MKAGDKIKEEDILPDIGPFGFYLTAFNELSTCRPSGMEAMAIPFTAIVEYAKTYEVDCFDEFLGIIRGMDNEMLRLERLKANKSAKTKKDKK